MFWPDLLRKFVRRAAYSMNRSGAQIHVKKLAKLFRASRGPWSSCKFGKLLADSKNALLAGLADGSLDQSFVEMYLPAIARDHGKDPDHFSMEDFVAAVKGKSGWIH